MEGKTWSARLIHRVLSAAVRDGRGPSVLESVKYKAQLKNTALWNAKFCRKDT